VCVGGCFDINGGGGGGIWMQRHAYKGFGEVCVCVGWGCLRSKDRHTGKQTEVMSQLAYISKELKVCVGGCLTGCSLTPCSLTAAI
jgi:hypothetical protein